jgi:hypothetical protein
MDVRQALHACWLEQSTSEVTVRVSQGGKASVVSNRDFGKKECILVPFTTTIGVGPRMPAISVEVHVAMSASDKDLKCWPTPKLDAPTSGEQGGKQVKAQFVVPFWAVESAPDSSIANMSMGSLSTKRSVVTFKLGESDDPVSEGTAVVQSIPVLYNSKPVKSGATLLSVPNLESLKRSLSSESAPSASSRPAKASKVA